MDDLITQKKPEAKRVDCEDCAGTGYRDGDWDAPDREACFTCGGAGYRRKTKTMNVRYAIAAFEPVKARRDWPNDPKQTHRTIADTPRFLDAVALAAGLLETHTEVSLWRYDDRDEGEPIEGWIPKSSVIWSDPEPKGKEIDVRSTDGRMKVNRFHYDYKSDGGRRARIIFETLPGKTAQVPKFGTWSALHRLSTQWKCWDCNGTGNEGARESGRACHSCGGTGRG